MRGAKARNFKEISQELTETIKNVFVNIKDTTQRVDIKTLMDKTKTNNAVILFVDWRHDPCLKPSTG